MNDDSLKEPIIPQKAAIREEVKAEPDLDLDLDLDDLDLDLDLDDLDLDDVDLDDLDLDLDLDDPVLSDLSYGQKNDLEGTTPSKRINNKISEKKTDRRKTKNREVGYVQALRSQMKNSKIWENLFRTLNFSFKDKKSQKKITHSTIKKNLENLSKKSKLKESFKMISGENVEGVFVTCDHILIQGSEKIYFLNKKSKKIENNLFVDYDQYGSIVRCIASPDSSIVIVSNYEKVMVYKSTRGKYEMVEKFVEICEEPSDPEDPEPEYEAINFTDFKNGELLISYDSFITVHTINPSTGKSSNSTKSKMGNKSGSDKSAIFLGHQNSYIMVANHENNVSVLYKR